MRSRRGGVAVGRRRLGGGHYISCAKCCQGRGEERLGTNGLPRDRHRRQSLRDYPPPPWTISTSPILFHSPLSSTLSIATSILSTFLTSNNQTPSSPSPFPQ